MFKALDIWMAELEEEFYNDYMRAFNALKEWTAARRGLVRDVNTWEIRDSLQGNYRQYCCLSVSKKYREQVVTKYDATRVFLIDTLVIGDNEYEMVVANGPLKDEADKISWQVEHKMVEEFKKELNAESGWGLFLYHRRAYAADVQLVEGRDEPWIRARAHKDMIRHKEALEAKIMKICEKIDSVEEIDNEYFVRGTNGHIAHVWRILAGGYNIQRLHTRCLVKEVKVK